MFIHSAEYTIAVSAIVFINWRSSEKVHIKLNDGTEIVIADRAQIADLKNQLGLD